MKVLAYGGVAAVVLARLNNEKVVLKIMNATSGVDIELIKTHLLEL